MKFLIILLTVYSFGFGGIVEKIKLPKIKEYIVKDCYPHPWFTGAYAPPTEFTEIIKNGKNSIPELLIIVNDANDSVRLAGYWALRKITNKNFGSSSDIFFLDSNVNRRTIVVKSWVEWWNKNKEKKQIDWLIEDLSDTCTITAKNAAIELGNIKDKDVIAPLERALVDQRIQFYVTGSLAQHLDKQCIPFIIDLYLTNDSKMVRAKGIKWLKEMYGKDLGFDPEASIEKRNQSIAQWKKIFNGPKLK